MEYEEISIHEYQSDPVIQWISKNAKATDTRREYTKLYDP